MAKTTGEKLQALRGQRSIEDAAQLIRISPQALTAYEQGERIPRDTVKIRIATAYNMPIEAIF